MPNYEDYVQRLKMYIENIAAHCLTDYEIIVVEDQTNTNIAFVRDFFTKEWLDEKKARIIEYFASYPNPHGYNMIEAFAKNVGLHYTKYPYVCITNCDVLFNTAFFDLCATRLEPATFYRFLEYETPPVMSWDLESIEATFGDAVCINPNLRYACKWSLKNIAYKSGDAMLLDRESWLNIKGFPENEVWVHSDLIVCTVVNNNGFTLKVEEEAKVYTYPQTRTLVERPFELQKTYEYLERKTCN
jgi:cellulose synthase/poly-beta-1,6-N-acetylglucosamine synthase-like glycosyltransferase